MANGRDDKFAREFGARLLRVLTESGYSQQRFATVSKIGSAKVNKYVNGKQMPSLKTFKKICILLKCDPAWLMFGAKGVKK